MARVLGINIEGIGIDTSKTGGAVFCNNRQPPTSATFEWIDAVEGSPGQFSSRLDPFTGRWSGSSMTLRLDASDRLATMLLATQRDLYYSLASSITAAATSLTVQSSLLPPSADTVSAGSVVYIDDEAILLGTHAGSGVYTGCTRGMWGTTARAHAADAAVATSNPYIYRRLATVIKRSSAGAETSTWRGLLEDVEQDGANIVVKISSQLAAILDTQLNREARNVIKQCRRQSVTSIRIPVSLSDLVTPGATAEHWQLGDEYLLRVFQPSNDAPFAAVLDVLRVPDGSPEFIDVAVLEDAEQLYRVFAIDRAKGYAATSGLAKPYHPLAIALSLLVSTGRGVNGAYDVLGAAWGLGLTYLDTTVWEAAIAARPDLVIDQLVLGWDGEPVDVETVIREKLLRPYGYSLTEAADGSLALAKLRLPDLNVRAGAAALALDAYPEPKPRQVGRVNTRQRELVLDLGGPPFGEKDSFTITLADRSTRAGRMGVKATSRLDLTTVDPTRLTDAAGLTAYGQALVQGVALGLDSTPELHIRCASRLDTGLNIYPGVWASVNSLSITHAWWVAADGTRITLDATTVKGYGFVTAVTQPFHAAHMDVVLTMLANGLDDFVHLVAPAGVVESWDGGPQTVTLEATALNRAGDAATFAVGDQVTLWTSDGTLKDATVVTIGGITGDDVTVSGAFGAATPVAGDILRLAQSDEYSNNAHITGINQPWTFIADASTQTFLGPGTSRYDVYGTEMFVGASDPVAKGSEAAYAVLDDEAVTAPSTTTAWALDAFLEQRLADNETWLLLRDVPASQLLDGHHGGDLSSFDEVRPFAAASAVMSVAVVPVMLPPGWAGAQASLIARVANPGGYDEDNSVTLRLDLYDLSWRRIAKGADLEVFDTSDSTPEWQPVEVELALERPVERAGAGFLVLWVTGNTSAINAEAEDEEGEGAGGSAVLVQGGAITLPGGGAFFNDTSAPRPNADDLAVTAFVISRWDAGGVYVPDDMLDPLWQQSASMFVGPAIQEQGYIDRIARYSITYLQVRGIEWSIYHADTGRPPAQLLEADAPTLGEVAAAHAARLAQVNALPRLSAVGPGGDVGEPYASAEGYAQRWPRELHDNASTPQVVMDYTFIPARYNPALKVLMGVVGTHCVSNNKDGSTVPLDPEWCSEATWEFQVDLYKFDATLGWVVSKTLQEDVTVLHQYTALQQRGLLISEYAQFNGDFPPREGSMYEKDLEFVQPVVLDLGAISYNPESEDELVRVRVTCTGSDTPTYTDKTHKDNRTRDRLQLAVAACSIYEVP